MASRPVTVVNVGYRSTNFWVISAGRSRLLLDLGWPGTLGTMLAQLKAKGVPVSEVAYGLATHYHPDHAGLAQELKQYGMRLLVPAEQTAFLGQIKKWLKPADRYVDIAHERLAQGDALLVFAEGRRSRTGGMQPMLAGATRYFDGPETWVLPVGITGTEKMFPVGVDRLYAVPIEVRVGAPIEARALREQTDGDRRQMIDRVGAAVAALLPPSYQGVYAAGT